MPGAQPDFEALRSAFPSVPDATILEALKNHGSVDEAANELLQHNTAPPARRRRMQRAPQDQQQRHTASWGTLAAATPPPLPPPRFTPAGQQRQAAQLTAADFPVGPSGHQAGTSSWQPQQAATTALPHNQRGPAAAAAASQSVAAAEERLLQQHGWAGRDLVAAVLQAAGNSKKRAAAQLADMVAGSLQASGQPVAAAQPQHVAIASRDHPTTPEPDTSSCSDDDNAEPGAQQDSYYIHRRGALRLSRQWRRAARAAATAFSAGQHSEARRLAQQAQRLRHEALAAHAEAAERIESDNNRHNSLFELDLHGLHVEEATAALDRRLALLHGILADPGTAAAAGRPGGTPASSGLRVVVGRGAHSSTGEASLARAVENHLKAAGLRYQSCLGALDVRLKSAVALHAAARAAPQHAAAVR